MPGIVGRIGGAPPDDREIDQVFATLHHFPFYESARDRAGGAWLGWIGVGRAAKRLVRAGEQGHLVVYHGDRIERLGDDERRELSHAIAALIASRPADLAARLGGSFAVASLDLVSGEFHCLTDLWGHHRVYYRHEGDSLFVACELKAFLGWPQLPAAADPQTLCDLVNYGYPLGDRTSLAGVKLLPPASRLSFRAGQVTVQRYWRPQYQPEEGDDDRFCEEGYRLFAAAFAEKTAGAQRLVVPISGGLDSRLLLGEGLKSGKDILAYTFGHSRSREAAVAMAAGRHMGADPVRVVTDEFRDPEDTMRRTAWFAEGMVDAAVSLVARVADGFATEPRSSLFVNGIYGGPTNFSDTYGKSEDFVMGLPRAEKVARIGRTMFSGDMHTAVNYRKLRPDFARICDQAYDREIERVLAEYEAVSPVFSHQKDAFFIDNRLCRFMNQVDLNRYYWDEVIPLTSVPLYAFYLRLPDRLKRGRLLHRQILARYLPQAAGAVVFATGISLHAQLAGRAPRRVGQRAQTLRYYAGRLTAGRLNLPDPEDYYCHDYLYRRNPGLRRYFEGVLSVEQPLSADAFDFAVVRQYLRMARRGSTMVNVLSLVLAWELWLRQLRARRWDV